MTSTRRIGSETSARRDVIIQAAVEVLQDEGATSLTAARIAERAGVKAHMVHYYFRNMDELVIALVRKHGEIGLRNTARAIASDEPLRGLWEIELAYRWGIAAMEFGALAAHRAPIRTEMKRYLEQMRSLQAEALGQYFKLRQVESPFPPLAITVLIAAIARHLVRERALDVSLGHDEVMAVVEEFLSSMPSRRAQRKPSSPRRANGSAS
jgi:TetR/AcrR family transcriptional regulator